MDKSEKRFERDIESFLISPAGGYTQFCGQDAEGTGYITASTMFPSASTWTSSANSSPRRSRRNGPDTPSIMAFRLRTSCIIDWKRPSPIRGLLYVLRNGIEDMGCKLKVCFFKPESDLNPVAAERYEANILLYPPVPYSTANTNTIDMALSVNGIPVVALELKNQFTGQDYICAINQYKNDRSSKEFAFRLNHRFLVYFAVDLYEVWMTTQLADEQHPFSAVQSGFQRRRVWTGGRVIRKIRMAMPQAICGKRSCSGTACWT